MNIRLVSFLSLILACFIASCSDSPTGSSTKADTLGTITFVIDGQTRTAFVDTSQVVAGVLNSSARWNETVPSNSGVPVTLLLRCGVIIPDTIGTYSVTTNGGIFYALLGVADLSGGVNTVHYRADGAGGSGTIIVSAVDSAKTTGIFDVIAYNESKPSDTKHVTGNFEVEKR